MGLYQSIPHDEGLESIREALNKGTKIHCFMITLKGVLPCDTLSQNFLINCNTLSHNFYQKRTPCRIIFTVKGHPVERHIPSSQVWEYPPPRGDSSPLSILEPLKLDEKQVHVKNFSCKYLAVFIVKH